jgi:hypothetical protein
VLACGVFAFVSGWGPLSPIKAHREYGMTMVEAVRMWMSGSPPTRMCSSKSENMEVGGRGVVCVFGGRGCHG